MKIIISTTLLLALFVFLYSCDNTTDSEVTKPENENPGDSTNVIDPFSTISVRVTEKKPLFRSGNHANARFITLYAWDMMMMTTWQRDIPSFTEEYYYKCRDTIENKIKFKGRDVIDEAGKLGEFLFVKDVVLRVAKDSAGNYVNKLNYTGTLDLESDTVAYIPNKVMSDNLKKIQELYDRQDFEACYQMFDTAYIFVPITGAEWLKLKAEGKE